MSGVRSAAGMLLRALLFAVLPLGPAASWLNEPPAAMALAPAPRLRLEQVLADSTSFNVNAVIILGPTEALLWDAQYHVRDAERLAEKIAGTGKRLKAIVLSHPDHDHYSGTAVILKRFPGTPVYMTPTALAEFNKTAARDFGNEKARNAANMADSVVTPVALPSNHLTVDGEAVDVIPDLQGDVMVPTNSMLWIPSLRAVLAADVLFNGVHPWFGASTPETRAAWQKSLQRITDLKPLVVVAGHKRTVDTPDSPPCVEAMAAYLRDFDAQRQASPDGPALITAMKQKYPDWKVPVLLQYSAMMAYRGAKRAAQTGASNNQGSASNTATSSGGKWEPVGVYDFTFTMPQRQAAGRIVISGSTAKYEGTIAPVMAPEPVALESVSAGEGKMQMAFTIPGQGAGSIEVSAVTADSLVGKFTSSMGVADAVLKKVR